MELDTYTNLVKEYTKPVTKCNWGGKSNRLCVVYVEFRYLDIIPWNLYNLANVYGESGYDLVILCGGENVDIIQNTVKDWSGGLHIVKMFENNIDIPTYNRTFTDYNFYKLFEKYEYMLINQWDTYIFKQIPEKFYKYDYIGAPWGHTMVMRDGAVYTICGKGCGCGDCKNLTFEIRDSDRVIKIGNGGFSFRNIRKMMDVCKSPPFTGVNEDVLFSIACENVPDIETAKEFAVEHLQYEGVPVGCHQIWLFQSPEYIKGLFKSSS